MEWFHLDVSGQACRRCSDTGDEIKEVARNLAVECRKKGVVVELKETLLAPGEIDRSNLITINGEPIEEALGNAHAPSSSCDSCGELIGEKAGCRTVVHFGEVHEAVPQKLISGAVCRKAKCC